MRTNTNPRVIQAKQKAHEMVLKFARNLADAQAPRTMALKSIMKQYGLKVREARAVYKEAQGKK